MNNLDIGIIGVICGSILYMGFNILTIIWKRGCVRYKEVKSQFEDDIEKIILDLPQSASASTETIIITESKDNKPKFRDTNPVIKYKNNANND
jgi:hypothetical protein